MSLSIETAPVPLATDADGTVRVRNTRVSLDTLISAFQNGATAEEIAHQYPSLQLADIYSIVGYYLRQRPAVEAYLHQRRQQGEAVRQQNEGRCDPMGVRDRLLARQANTRA